MRILLVSIGVEIHSLVYGLISGGPLIVAIQQIHDIEFSGVNCHGETPSMWVGLQCWNPAWLKASLPIFISILSSVFHFRVPSSLRVCTSKKLLYK